MNLVKVGRRIINLDLVTDIRLDPEIYGTDPDGTPGFHRPGDAVHLEWSNGTEQTFRGPDAVALRDYLIANARDITPPDRPPA